MTTPRMQPFLLAALVGAIVLASITFNPAPAAAQESTESPLVKQMYNGQWPAQEDYAKFKDQLFFARA